MFCKVGHRLCSSTLRLGSQGSGCESCMCGFRLLSTYLRVRVLGLGGVCLVWLDRCLLSIYLRDRSACLVWLDLGYVQSTLRVGS